MLRLSDPNGLHTEGTIAVLQRDVLELLISSKALIARQARRSRLANSGERVKRIEAELAAYRSQLERGGLEP